MKTNQKWLIKLVSLTLLALMIGVFTQCVATNSEQIGTSSSNSNSSNSSNSSTNSNAAIQEAEVSIGIRSFEQLRHSYATITGVSGSNSNIMSTYNQVTTSLPTTNDLKVFQSANQLAVTKLAYSFCNIAMTSTASRMAMLPGTYLLMDALPAVAYSPANRDLILDEIMVNFFGGILSVEEEDQARLELDQLITELLLEEGANLTTTRRVGTAVCTAALSSAHVTLY